MIRFADDADRAAIVRIWQACFGDDERYIQFFLDRLFSPESSLLQEEDGRPVAMLHLLPLQYIRHGVLSKTQYIYAAATLPEYRRRGLMGGLIDYACETGASRGLPFTTLLPASTGLYAYYEKLGFQKAFSIRRAALSRSELLKAAEGAEPADVIVPDYADMYRQRAACFQNALLWEPFMFAYVLDEWRFTGGDILAFKNGYALCRRTENGLFVKELCLPGGGLGPVLKSLLQRYDCRAFIFHLPADTGLLHCGAEADVFSSLLLPYGMLRAAGSAGDAVEGRPYFNLMLD